MDKPMKKWILLAVVTTISGLTANAAQSFTYIDLIKRLTDLETLAVLPEPGEKCAQWSSYDRASKFDEATGKYLRWDANGDGRGIIRTENGLQVLAEMQGPGCIWRIWSAAPKEGRVQIYLDDSQEPAVDLPFAGYFDGKNEPFTRKALVHVTARGWNNYTPIPFQRSCKIVAQPNWGNYYHFTYTTYPPGTRLPTFKRTLTAEESAELDRANDILSRCGQDPAGSRAGESINSKVITLPPGKTVLVASLTGPRAITGIRARLSLPASPEDRTALREVAWRIRWDGETTPSVWAPFGDFFGTAAGANAYRSLPAGLTPDGWWYSYWYMPFSRSAVVELSNDGQSQREVTVQITDAPLTKPVARLGRFHSKWHRDIFLPSEPERAIDWTMIKTTGAGRFCGVMLHIWNPKGGWWGEGDEKFFVDGEKFPSTIGTGSEDYFGYAWGDPALFQNAYHNQTISMNNKGHVSVNRWHITDNVPFQKQFEGCIEKYFPNSRPTLYAATVYWYLEADGNDPYPEAPLSQRVGYWVEPVVFTVKGALEGERLQVLRRTGGQTRVQDLSGLTGDWSQGAHLWWTGGKIGDQLDLAIPVAKAGKYRLTVALTKARDYGTVQLMLDGNKLGEPIDLYNPNVVPSGPIEFGPHDLTAGEHKFTVEITGANPAAIKSYMFGLDYIKLTPAE